MPSDRKPSLILPVAVTLALLLLSYMGAYYWCVTPDWTMAPYYGARGASDTDRDEWNERLAPFFRPAHWLDRRLRPRVWEWRG